MEKLTATRQHRIVIVDDHLLLRDALSYLINGLDEFKVMDVAENGAALASLIKSGNIPDMVILDINMPEMDGYETACWLSQHHPAIKVIVLTVYDSDIAILRLLQYGISSILRKDISSREFRKALETVAEEGSYFSSHTCRKIAGLFKNQQGNKNALQRSLLSETEIEFLKLAATDLTYHEIARQLKLTKRKVENYREALFEKLGVKSRVGLSVYAMKNGIVCF